MRVELCPRSLECITRIGYLLGLSKKYTSIPILITIAVDCTSLPPNEDSEALKIREDLEHVLKKNHNKITFRYASYIRCIRLSLQDSSVIEMRSFLLSLNAFQSRHSVQCKLLSGVRAKLEEADTIHRIFDIITNDWASFWDYEIFESIVKEYNTLIDQGQDALKYSGYFKAYIEKHQISEIAKVISIFNISTVDSKELTIKLDIEETCGAAKIRDLKRAVASILKLMPSAIRLIGISKGCVVAKFSLSIFVADIIFTRGKRFTPEEEKRFCSFSVLWLECNGFKFYFKKMALEVVPGMSLDVL